jgi:hypothetical protein
MVIRGVEKITQEPLCSVFLTKYYLGDKIKKSEIDRACSTYGEQERCLQGFSGEPEGMESLGRPKHRWDDNIKMDI